MRRYFRLNIAESLSLVAIFFSWLILILAKRGVHHSMEALPFPIAIFWMGTGSLFSSIFFHYVLRTQGLPWKVTWRGFPMVFCGLCAYHLYFFHEIPTENQNRPYFFMWVPLLYWATSLIFYGGQKKLIFFRLMTLSIFCLLLFREGRIVPIIASHFLVAFGLMAFRRKGEAVSSLLSGIISTIIISGAFSFLYWQEPGSFCMKEVYYAFGGGFILGFTILIFLEGFQYFNIRTSLVAISTAVLLDLAIPAQGIVVILFSFPLLFFAIICLKTARKIGLNQEALPIHPAL